MLIATWNVNSLSARMPRVEEWLATVQPDVLCMQETKLTDAKFPAMAFAALGYESAHHGLNQWNGVAILSKHGIDDVSVGFDDGGEPDPDARIIWGKVGPVRLASAYIPNGREVGHEHYRYKLDWLGRLRTHLDKHYTPDELLVVMGDWNIMPADIDVWSPKAFEGSTHVTPAEREALQHVKDWGLVDTFRERYDGVEGLYSYWDYRAGDFHQKRGLRIDYLLASRALAELNRSDLIDRNTRKGSKPSDHAAVLSWYDVEV